MADAWNLDEIRNVSGQKLCAWTDCKWINWFICWVFNGLKGLGLAEKKPPEVQKLDEAMNVRKPRAEPSTSHSQYKNGKW